VRLRAVVLNITKLPMPNEFITDFLLVLIEDENYFSSDLLWGFEVDLLEFDSLGATRQMTPEVEEKEVKLSAAGISMSSNSSAQGRDRPDDPDRNIYVTVEEEVFAYAASIEGEGNSSTKTGSVAKEKEFAQKFYEVKRARLIIQNFIFMRFEKCSASLYILVHLFFITSCISLFFISSLQYRILVNHVILSPWCCNLSPSPAKSTRSARRILYNHRMLATVVYELMRSLEPSMPPIVEGGTVFSARAATSEGGGAAPAVAAPAATALPNVTDLSGSTMAGGTAAVGDTTASDANPFITSGKISSTIGSAIISAAVARSSVSKRSSSSSKITSGADTYSVASTAASSAQAAAGTAAGAAVPQVQHNGLLVRMSKLFGMADTTPGGQEGGGAAAAKGSVEDLQLAPRPEYCSLSELHALLLPTHSLDPLRAELEEWFVELKAPLRAWMQRLLTHILTRRAARKAEKRRQEAAAAFAAGTSK
jgi:hypothetical protein